ncbi:MAG: RuvX/YqgF family protein [Actinomycetes bacterium]|jgi:putative Holliday junction resolvase|nr:RuvX/YqgF family protein [Actinomycetes bacterium]
MGAQAEEFGQGRVLALDVGELRCGLALSDVARKHASPLAVLPTADLLRVQPSGGGGRLREIVAEWEVAGIVVGLPLESDGSEGSQARHVRALGGKIVAGLGLGLDVGAGLGSGAGSRAIPSAPALSLVWYDERKSSVQAKAAGHEVGLSERAMRGHTDSRAAAVFLQRWLDETKGDLNGAHEIN